MTSARDSRIFHIELEDHSGHPYIAETIGLGKSTLTQLKLVKTMASELRQFPVPPRRDLTMSPLRRVPSFHTKDVIYCDSSDQQHRVPFNPFAYSDRLNVERHRSPQKDQKFEATRGNITLMLLAFPDGVNTQASWQTTHPLYWKLVITRILRIAEASDHWEVIL